MEYARSAIPSLEETLHAVISNRYLSATVQLAHAHRDYGCSGADCIDQMIAGDIHEEEEHNCPQLDLLHHIRGLSLQSKLSAVPYLRRLGYSVILFHDFDSTCPFSIQFPGRAQSPSLRRSMRAPHEYLYATSPGALRLRGFLWCSARLMRWKQRSLRYFQGALGTLLAEAVAEYEAMQS